MNGELDTGRAAGTTNPDWKPMSLGQRALWFNQLAEPASNAYNLGACLRFSQPLDSGALRDALARLVECHALMRARFDLVDGEPCWTISRQPLVCTPLSESPVSESVGRERVSEMVLRPYVLANEHPFRFALVELEGGGSLFAIACHHIVSDLHSLAVLVHDLDSAYTSGQSGAHAHRVAADYAEYCEWQREMLSATCGLESATFWKERLANVTTGMGLGALATGSTDALPVAASIEFRIGSETSRALTNMAVQAGTTHFVAVLTTFQVLLAHRCHRSTVVVGTPTSGRKAARFLGTVGYFVNLLPMVLNSEPEESYASALARNGKLVRSALAHGQFPFAEMIENMGPSRAHGSTPVVQATLTFQKTVSGLEEHLARLALGLPGGRLPLAGQFGEMLPLPETWPQFPLGIGIAPIDGGFSGCLQFDQTKIMHETAERFLQDWLSLNEACAARPDNALGDLLAEIAPVPRDDSLHTLVSELQHCIARHADRTAISGRTGDVTYRALGERSAAIAANLQTLEIGRGDRVAVIGDGGANTVCAMVGILRTGAAFVPIDPDIGEARIDGMLRVARVSAIVACADASAPWSNDHGIPVISSCEEYVARSPVSVRCGPLDPAWLMFTSGTTGTPKAAVIPHEAAVAHARAILKKFELHPEDRVLQFASLSFDEHAEEIFPTLLAGGCVVCIPRIRFQDPESLLHMVQETAVSVLHLPTSYWHLWMDEAAHQPLPLPGTLRLVNAGGEQASLARLRVWSEVVPPRVRWFNSYGLTEAAVTSLVYEFPGDRKVLQGLSSVPVGKPLAGTSIRIIVESEDAAVAGEVGELQLGGAGVGLGYLDNIEATTSRFFSEGIERAVRWIRTGDLAYTTADGDVVIVGRRDRSIKLRGARVDPPEVEAALGRHPAVQECVVAMSAEDGVRGDSGLDLHVVVRHGHAVSESELRDFWKGALSAVPPPARICFCGTIPRTAGRKPDFAKLNDSRAIADQKAPARASRDALSRAVEANFSRLLQHERVDPSANFFSLGGHSLMAMRLVASLRRDTGVEFSIADFLCRPTLEGVIETCRARGGKLTGHSEPPTTNAAGPYPLSHAQRRALVLAAAVGEDTSRVLMVLRFVGEVHLDRLDRAWQAVLSRHSLLDAEISEAGNRAQQEPHARSKFQRIAWTPPHTLVRSRLATSARAAFARYADRSGPINAAILSSGDSEHALVIEARHTAVDGGCISLLLGDFASAYTRDVPLPLLAEPGYSRFVAAEADWLASPAHTAAVAYWEDRLQHAGRPTRLACMSVVNSSDFSSRRLGITLGTSLKRELLTIARSHHCTPYAALLAAFLVFISRQSASEDVLIGVPVSLRDALGVGDVVGPTLNPLPFRAHVLPGDSYAELLLRTRDALSASFEHAALPFEEIAARCNSLREMRGVPIPIQFVAQVGTTLDPGGHAPTFAELPERDGQSPVALLVGIRIDDSIRIDFEYRRALLTDTDAVRLINSFRTLVNELARHPARKVREARMLPDSLISCMLSERSARVRTDASVLLHDGLEAFAKLDPQRVAIVCGKERLTYQELDKLANHHTARLIEAGIVKGDRVVVASRKGIAEVVAALAILKAGGVYVPIAFDMPTARAAILATRVGARLVTGATDFANELAGDSRIEFVPVELHQPSSISLPAPIVDTDASAYILFTSGSTGEPKGVEVSHRAAMVTINEVLRRFDIGGNDVFYRLSDLGFDLSVFDIFGALGAGGKLVIPSPESRSDAFVWAEEVMRHGITIWNSVPSALDMLLEVCDKTQLPSLRYLLASGDWIGLDLPARAKSICAKATFVALGGATEASIWSNCHVVDVVDPNWRSIPYGKALDGQSMFIVESGGWPAPTAVPGEICIGGAGLATGYWGDTALTAEKFVQHAISGRRIYRTGDLGRYFPDGSIEFLGRIDKQVKLRGYRIETGEVEAAVSTFQGVQRALVAIVPFSGSGVSDCIVAYVRALEATQIDFATLRRHVESRLPDYMRPAHYFSIQAVPLTGNGKIDWGALPVPGRTADRTTNGGSDDFSETERRIAGLWRELLPNFEPVRNDNFFSRGGHSLLAVRFVARVRREFDRELSLSRWLDEPSIAHMARLVEARDWDRSHGESRAIRSATSLRERVQLAGDIVFSPPRSDGHGTVFVTGASGLIGSRLIAELLAQSKVNLVCLVRTLGAGGAEGQLSRFLRDRDIPESQWRGRIRFVQGDLTQARFGHSRAEFQSLAAGLSSVFHVGAAVNLMAGYEALEPANVDGTHEAIRLAALAGVTLQHVSSIGVLPYGAGRLVTETDSIDVPGQLLTGYCQSKWVAEQIVRLAAARGLKTTIYRPGLTLSGDSRRLEHDMLSALLMLAQKTGSLPSLDMPVDLVTADYVASAMMHLARDPRSAGGTFHLTHPHPIPMSDAVRKLARAGVHIPMLPFADWKARLECILPQIDDPRIVAIGALIANQEEADITPARIDCSRTSLLLRETPVHCTSVEVILGNNLTHNPTLANLFREPWRDVA